MKGPLRIQSEDRVSSSEPVDSGVAAQSSALHGPYFEVDDNLTITRWPEEASQHTKISAEEALGQPCWRIIHPEKEPPPPVCEHFCLARRNPTPIPDQSKKIDFEYCATVRLPDPQKGSLIWIPSRNPSSKIHHSPMEDLVVRGCMSTKVDNLDESLDFVRRYCAADDCEIFLLDPSSREVFYSGCVGFDRPAFSCLPRIPLGAGYPGGVTIRQEPMYTNDFQNERIFLRDSVRRCGIQSFLGVPLSEKGRPLGYLGLGWRDPSVPIGTLIPRLESILPLLTFGASKGHREHFSQPDLSGPLSIRCFGKFDVRRGGMALPVSAFKRRKALQLLKILLLHAPHPVHRDLLIESLWPGSDVTTGSNRLHGVVYALRAAIEPHWESRRFIYVRHEQDYYHLDTTTIAFIDLFRFRQMLAMAQDAKRRKDSSERMAAYLESAIALYHGDLFADDHYAEDWLLSHRTQLRHQYLEALRELVRHYVQMGRFEDVVSKLQEAVVLEPYAEDIYHSLIQTLILLGRRTEAMEYFTRCVQLIRQDLNVEPRPEILAFSKTLKI